MKLGENSLEYTDVTECLGVKIDNRLNWKAQTEKVGKAFAAKVKTIRSVIPVKVIYCTSCCCMGKLFHGSYDWN